MAKRKKKAKVQRLTTADRNHLRRILKKVRTLRKKKTAAPARVKKTKAQKAKQADKEKLVEIDALNHLITNLNVQLTNAAINIGKAGGATIYNNLVSQLTAAQVRLAQLKAS